MSDVDLEHRLDELEALVEESIARDEREGSSRSGVSRRSILQTLGIVGLGSYAAGTAAADPQGQLGTGMDPLRTVYTQAIDGGVTGGTTITDLLGDGLDTASGQLQTAVTGASNRGGGVAVFTGNDGGDLGFRSLVAGTDITLSTTSGEVTIDANDTDTHTDVSDSGTAVVSNVGDIDFGSNLTVTDDTDGSVTVDATTNGESNTASNAGNGAGVFQGKSGADLVFRSLTTAGALTATENTDTVEIAGPWADPDGDTLLEPRSGTGYTGIDLTGVAGARVVAPWVGTTDATAFEAFVAGDRVARFGTTGTDQDGNPAAGNVLLGQYAQVTNGATGVAIGGGGSATGTEANVVADNYGTIAGGQDNLAGTEDTDPETADHATVGGGRGNVAGARYGTIAGGSNNAVHAETGTIGGGYGHVVDSQNGTIAGGTVNQATSTNATVAGGNSNVASGEASTIGGGYNSEASGQKAMVLGGRDNLASGRLSLAVGHGAKTETAGGTVHDGAFVWSDETNTVVRSTAANEVRFQASGGFAIQDGDLAIEGSNAIADASGNTHLTINDSGPLGVGRALDLSGNDLVDGGTTIWDASASYVPQGRLENEALSVTAGTGLTGGGSVALGASTTLGIDTDGVGTNEIATDAVTGVEIDLDSIAGDNVTVDTANDRLDVTNASANMVESDADGLLEPASGYTGIDVATMQADEIQGAGGFTHLTLTSGGPLSVNQPLQMNAQPIRSDPGVGLTFQTDTNRRTLALGAPESDGNTNTAGGTVLGGHPNNVVNAGVGVVIAGGGANNGNENSAGGNYATVSGGRANAASANHATVSGGYNNSATTQYATVGGGQTNAASASSTTVGGGYNNSATAQYATAGGGTTNSATGNQSTVAGGNNNSAIAQAATVGGGQNNNATANYAMSPGGLDNDATGQYSLAAGRQAETRTSGGTNHDGAFVWGDSTTTTVRSQANDQFVVQASKGVYVGDDDGPGGDFYTNNSRLIETSSGAYLTNTGVWTDSSSRTVKEAVTPVDGLSILDAVESLSINEWSYEGETDVRHVGPMAEEFYGTFGLGNDDEHIASLDTAGVALAAIQGLTGRLSKKDDRIETLEKRVDRKDDRIDDLEDDREALEGRLDQKDERIDELESRLDRIESALDLDDPT